jgi:hypothetical protein
MRPRGSLRPRCDLCPFRSRKKFALGPSGENRISYLLKDLFERVTVSQETTPKGTPIVSCEDSFPSWQSNLLRPGRSRDPTLPAPEAEPNEPTRPVTTQRHDGPSSLTAPKRNGLCGLSAPQGGVVWDPNCSQRNGATAHREQSCAWHSHTNLHSDGPVQQDRSKALAKKRERARAIFILLESICNRFRSSSSACTSS